MAPEKIQNNMDCPKCEYRMRYLELLTGIAICIYEEMLKDNTNLKFGINEIYLELELQYENFKTKILENNPNEEIDEYSMQQLFISHQKYKGMPLELYAIKELFNNMELAIKGD
jgi:hypothetical protein